MKIVYRPEIDGLRAIAVVSVILYHAKINVLGQNLFDGGFIGVDIFFVISGYLITSIILKELITTGSFSFKNFYERRVRRILPVLLIVMLASIQFAWMYLLPSSFVDFSKSIIYSLGFTSNFYFHYSGQIYGAENGLYKPFLHTWSLSVEEQFYILFPLTLFVTFRYFRKYLLHILILGFAISLAIAEWTSRNYPSISFYFIHTRMWELLAGSVLAYFEIKNGHRCKQKTLNNLMQILGLTLICFAILIFSDEMFHPSLITLLSIIGVCLIIWFSNKDEFITKILSSKIFVGVGLISYSLYLWHYPIFAFVRITEVALENTLIKIILIPIVFILSIFSYHFIEQPFRNRKYNFKKLFTILIISILFIISISVYVVDRDGIKSRIPQMFQEDLLMGRDSYELFQKDNLRKVLLIGDSHSDTLLFNLNKEVKKNDLSLFQLRTFMLLEKFNRVNRKTKKKYNIENKKIFDFLENNSNLIVILHHRWSLKILETFYDNEEGTKEEPNLIYENYLEPLDIKSLSKEHRQDYIKQGLIFQINKIIKQGHKLILVYPVPEMGFNVPRVLNNNYIRERLNTSKFSAPILSGSYEVYKKRNKLIFEILDSVQDPNIKRVYPHKFFCNTIITNRCVANNNESIFYYDDDHLSLKGSQLVVNEIMKKINELDDN